MGAHAAAIRPLTEFVLARSSALGHLGTLRDASRKARRLRLSWPIGRLFTGDCPAHCRCRCLSNKVGVPAASRGNDTPQAAAHDALRLSREGRLDGDVVLAVLAEAGQARQSRRRANPAGLSDREVDVLSLAIRGLSNKQIGKLLFISPKTVGHHIQHIYDKTGVSTRVGATLFALEHGLVAELSRSANGHVRFGS